MTERIPIVPVRPHRPLQSPSDWSLWGADMGAPRGGGGLFTCYCIVLAPRLYREHQAQQVEVSEVIPV